MKWIYNNRVVCFKRQFVNSSIPFIPLIVVLIFANSVSFAKRSPMYAIFDIGDLNGGGFAKGWALNDSGQVVGEAWDGVNSFVPIRWDRGTMISLGSLGGFNGTAFDINNSGQIIGDSALSQIFDTHGFLWENGVMKDLGPITAANAINNLGMITGVLPMPKPDIARSNQQANAFIWENGIITPLGTFGPCEDHDLTSVGQEINDLGEVIGWSNFRNGDKIDTAYDVIWDANGNISRLTPTGAAAFFIGSINNNGHVLGGLLWNLREPWHAAVWDGEKIIDYTPDTVISIGASVVNDLDHVLGEYGKNKPAIWLKPGRPHLLRNELPPNHGWKVFQLETTDMNNHDQITGWGPHRKDETRGFFMTPVDPELVLGEPVPGIAGVVNSFTVTGAQPGAEVTFTYGMQGGGRFVPHCAVLKAVLQIDDAGVMGKSIADENGVATIEMFVPDKARDEPILMMQAFDEGNCQESQLMVIKFE